jgi:hypothetical protein
VNLRTLKGDSLKLANREFDGRNGDPAMTIFAHSKAMGGVSACFRARIAPAIRPSLDLSRALLLLLSCP